jgi:hypothetical protein
MMIVNRFKMPEFQNADKPIKMWLSLGWRRFGRGAPTPPFWSDEIPSMNFPLYFKIPFVLIYLLSKRNGRYEDKHCWPRDFARNFFRSWRTLSAFWELVLCRLLERCTNYWEDPPFRKYLVIKLSDVKSGSRTLNPGIWFPVSGQLPAMHTN